MEHVPLGMFSLGFCFCTLTSHITQHITIAVTTLQSFLRCKIPDEVIAVYQEASAKICIFLTVALSFDQASPKLCMLSISLPTLELKLF